LKKNIEFYLWFSVFSETGKLTPMMYRLTNAPAGLPFETEALLNGCGCVDPFKKQRFYDILGFDPSRSGLLTFMGN